MEKRFFRWAINSSFLREHFLIVCNWKKSMKYDLAFFITRPQNGARLAAQLACIKHKALPILTISTGYQLNWFCGETKYFLFEIAKINVGAVGKANIESVHLKIVTF